MFVDDYVLQTEPVEDYLTRHSGIVQQDLDPQMSSRSLITLKASYMKLRALVDRGCLLVGHGLRADFRTINIFVPPTQIIDTVELFFKPGQRKVSLRCLASYLLELDVQVRG